MTLKRAVGGIILENDPIWMLFVPRTSRSSRPRGSRGFLATIREETSRIGVANVLTELDGRHTGLRCTLGQCRIGRVTPPTEPLQTHRKFQTNIGHAYFYIELQWTALTCLCLSVNKTTLGNLRALSSIPQESSGFALTHIAVVKVTTPYLQVFCYFIVNTSYYLH